MSTAAPGAFRRSRTTPRAGTKLCGDASSQVRTWYSSIPASPLPRLKLAQCKPSLDHPCQFPKRLPERSRIPRVYVRCNGSGSARPARIHPFSTPPSFLFYHPSPFLSSTYSSKLVMVFGVTMTLARHIPCVSANTPWAPKRGHTSSMFPTEFGCTNSPSIMASLTHISSPQTGQRYAVFLRRRAEGFVQGCRWALLVVLATHISPFLWPCSS